MNSKSRTAATLVAGSTLAVTGGMLTAGPASASFTAKSDHLLFHVEGNGTFVNYMSVETRTMPYPFPPNESLDGFFEITGPKGIKVTGPTKTYAPGDQFAWTPNANEPAGTYCGTFWIRQYNGTFSLGDQACGPVS